MKQVQVNNLLQTAVIDYPLMELQINKLWECCYLQLLYDNATLGFYDKSTVRELMKECSKMYKFDHPNVLTLKGVCLDGGPAPYIIMPFMANGSLVSYLHKKRDSLVVTNGDKDDEEVGNSCFLRMGESSSMHNTIYCRTGFKCMV